MYVNHSDYCSFTTAPSVFMGLCGRKDSHCHKCACAYLHRVYGPGSLRSPIGSNPAGSPYNPKTYEFGDSAPLHTEQVRDLNYFKTATGAFIKRSMFPNTSCS